MKKSILLLLTLILCGFLPLSGKNTGTQQEINLKMPPAVFAVENAYQILVTVKSQSLVRIKVGKKFYSDHIRQASAAEERYISLHHGYTSMGTDRTSLCQPKQKLYAQVCCRESVWGIFAPGKHQFQRVHRT